MMTAKEEPRIPALFSAEDQNRHLRARAVNLETALRNLQNAVREHRLLDVRKRFSLCAADAAASKALTP